jgi:carbon-monoxide dehydrogenase medium subunit
VAYADPAAELPACLLALGAELEIAGPGGERRVQAEHFFKSLFETELGDRDVLTRIRVPVVDGYGRAAFAEFARRQGDYALVGLAACARADGSALADVRLAYFGVGAIPLRARHAEAALAAGTLEDAVAALRADLQPEDDLHASAAVRSHLAGVLLRRVAAQLREKPS